MSKRLVSPIGKYPGDWEIVYLRDITTKIGSGATPTGGQDTYVQHRQNFALIRSQNVLDRKFDERGLAFITDEQAHNLLGVSLKIDDILLNITGDGITFSRSCKVPESILPAVVNQHVSIIRVDETLADSGYILAYLTHPSIKKYIESFNAGGSRRAITKGHIESFVIPLPPLPTQHRIAKILSSFDDKIELNQQMNETLEAMARAIFQSWFVDFNPVRAKAEGRQPEGMDAATAALFPNGFEEVEGREVPRGWGVEPLSNSFDIKMGQSPPGTTYNENGEGIPFFQGRTDFGFRYPSIRVYCMAPTRFAEEGDTLVCVRAPVGDINLAPEKCCIGRGVASVRHTTGSRSFTYYQMLALKEVFALFESEGTVFGSIGKTDFNSIDCVTPPNEMVKRFEHIVFPIDQMIENNEHESRTLAQIRDTLLPKLMSGEIQVPIV